MTADQFIAVLALIVALGILSVVAWKDRLALVVTLAVVLVEEGFRSGFSTETSAIGLPWWMTYGHEFWVRPPRLPSLVVIACAGVAVSQVVFERGFGLRPRGRAIVAIAAATVIWTAAVSFEPGLTGQWLRPVSGALLLAGGILVGAVVMRRPPSDAQVVRFVLAFLMLKLVVGAATVLRRPAGMPDLVAYYDAIVPAVAGCVALTALMSEAGARRMPRSAVLMAVAVILVSGRRTPIVATILLAALLPVITGRTRAALRVATTVAVAVFVFLLVAPAPAQKTFGRLAAGVGTIAGTTSDESTRGHLDDLSTGWNLALDHPLLGLGSNAAQVSDAANVQTDALYLHNDYLQTWLRFGLPALIGLVAITALAAQLAVANLRRPTSSILILASLFCLFVPIYMVMFPATSTVQRWAVLYGIAIGMLAASPTPIPPPLLTVPAQRPRQTKR